MSTPSTSWSSHGWLLSCPSSLFCLQTQAVGHSTSALGPPPFPRGHHVSSPRLTGPHVRASESAHGAAARVMTWLLCSSGATPGAHADQRAGDAASTTTAVLAGPGRGDGDATVLPAPGAAPAAAPPAADAADASGCGTGSPQPLPQGPGQDKWGPWGRRTCGVLLIREGETVALGVHARLGLAGMAGCAGGLGSRCSPRSWLGSTRPVLRSLMCELPPNALQRPARGSDRLSTQVPTPSVAMIL